MTTSDKALAILSHLSALLGVGLLLPFIVWLVKRREPDSVAAHAAEALNFHLTLILFVVQNRSGRAVSGMTLNVSAGSATNSYTVPSLAAGESYVAKVPVDDIALKANGSLSFTTQLANPPGVVDQVPANNKRRSVLSVGK